MKNNTLFVDDTQDTHRMAEQSSFYKYTMNRLEQHRPFAPHSEKEYKFGKQTGVGGPVIGTEFFRIM